MEARCTSIIRPIKSENFPRHLREFFFSFFLSFQPVKRGGSQMFLSCHTRIQLGKSKRQNHNLYTPYFPFSFPFSFLLLSLSSSFLAFSRKSGCRGMIFLTLHGRFSKFILNVEDGIHNKREETKKRVFLSLFFAVEFFPVRRRNSGQKKIKE